MPSRTTRTITLVGPDAAGFANAQFGSAVLSLGTGHWQWSGWLDPKGRVRALLQIARIEDERFVVVPRGGDAETLASDLKRFVFRSKVKITVSDVLHVSDGEATGDGEIREEDDALSFGEGDTSIRISVTQGDDAWYARHIEKGYSWLPDEAIDALLPPALSMERLGAVAFNKGCFPGQEIAARLHFLGGHKKHLRVVRSDAVWREGETLRVNGRDIGMVLMHAASLASSISLVVLDDSVATAETLEIDDKRLHIISTFDA